MYLFFSIFLGTNIKSKRSLDDRMTRNNEKAEKKEQRYFFFAAKAAQRSEV